MKEHLYFATCPKGLEQLLEDELVNLGAISTKQTVAGVSFAGNEETAYRVCLWSRFSNRVLFPIINYPAPDANALYKGALKVNWEKHMAIPTTFKVDFNGTSDTLKNTQFASQRIKDAIVDQFRDKLGDRPTVEKEDPMLRVNATLRKNLITLSIDLSGESLHKRGYRLEAAAAPLKENLAAAILYRARWPAIAKEGGTLVDPMCGSGTILIEGLLMAGDIAPGIYRKKFGFHGWRQYKEKIWQKLQQEAVERAKKGKQGLISSYYGLDVDPDAIDIAQSNVRRAELENFINPQTKEISHLQMSDIRRMSGLCIINPPYGERLEEADNLLPLYKTISRKLKENFLNWEAAILTGNLEVSRCMGLRAYKKYVFFNGKIPCQLLLFHIKPEWFVGP